MIEAAVRQGFRVFALTEHMPRDEDVDLYPEEIEASQTPADLSTTFDAYYHEARRLQEAYASQIKILIGFESDWIRPSSETLIEDLRQKYAFDLFVGSVHHLNTIAIDFDRPLYEKARHTVGGTDEDAFVAYFDAQLDMLQRLKPPIVGHFDLIRLRSDDPNVDFRTFPRVWDKIVRNLEFVVQYGGVVEINSAALRKGMHDPYPNRRIVEVFIGLGGRLTLSDDSHATDQVGQNYHRLVGYLRDLGVTEIYYFDVGTADVGGVPTLCMQRRFLRASYAPG
ncbi:MAG: histidinolphosphatase [Lichina confinis]|nr:MAG: histidinolphosphatase [Lichina confinis]